jgi:hypothetical protein
MNCSFNYQEGSVAKDNTAPHLNVLGKMVKLILIEVALKKHIELSIKLD